VRISFDLDGTAYDFPEFFRELAWAMKERGHEVGVLTGHKHESAEHDSEKLVEMGFPRPDFYFGRTAEYMHLNGAHRKSDVIRDFEIAIHFDDYDYANPDTARLFAQLGQEGRIFRVRSKRELEAAA
jgi:FMN phosphatase YigB (HAD superfamily)